MEYFHVLSVKLTLWLRMTPSKRLVSGSKVLRICNHDTWGIDDDTKAMIILFFEKESSVYIGYPNGYAAFFLPTELRTAVNALKIET
jgi:hypothetical protein